MQALSNALNPKTERGYGTLHVSVTSVVEFKEADFFTYDFIMEIPFCYR